MELRHLRYFVAVAEELHFGRAAKRLHMASPPLSQQIKQLEAEVGFPLFERSTRQVRLTPGGQALLSRARDLLAAAEDAVAMAAKYQTGKAGVLSVGFAGSSTYELLPKVARLYRNRYPGVELHLRGEMLSGIQLEAIRNRQLDVGFVRPFTMVAGVEVETVLTEPLVAMLPATHPLADAAEIDPAQLAGEPFVLYRASGILTETVNTVCARAGFTPIAAQYARESYTVACLVAAGYGVALVPNAARHLTLNDLVYVPLATDVDSSIPLAVAWRKDNHFAAVRNFLAIVHEIVGQGGTSCDFRGPDEDGVDPGPRSTVGLA